MRKIYKLINIFMLIFVFVCFSYADDSNNIKKAKPVKNYEVYVPQVLSLDSRTSLNRNEINIIDNKTFNILSKYKRIFTKEINTMGLKYSTEWIERLQDIAKEIKKKPNTIVILEGFRNTEITDRENIALSKEHTLFIASILRDIYRIKNTMAAIGKGLEKNENFNYNCVIISLIKDINPSDTIQ